MHDAFFHSDNEEFFGPAFDSPDYSVTKQFRDKWKRYKNPSCLAGSNLLPHFQK